jgi:hypothetical protein
MRTSSRGERGRRSSHDDWLLLRRAFTGERWAALSQRLLLGARRCRYSSFGRLGALLAANWDALFEIQYVSLGIQPWWQCKPIGLLKVADSWIGVR